MLEVWKLGDGTLYAIAEQIAELAKLMCNHVVPFAYLAGESLGIPLLPVIPLVTDVFEDAQLLGVVEHADDRQMAAQEMGDAAALGIAGILGFAKTAPKPPAQPCADIFLNPAVGRIIHFDGL